MPLNCQGSCHQGSFYLFHLWPAENEMSVDEIHWQRCCVGLKLSDKTQTPRECG